MSVPPPIIEISTTKEKRAKQWQQEEKQSQ